MEWSDDIEKMGRTAWFYADWWSQTILWGTKEKKIEFGFYDNKLIKLELLQICYDKSKDRLEIEFRDVIGDYLREWKEVEK